MCRPQQVNGFQDRFSGTYVQLVSQSRCADQPILKNVGRWTNSWLLSSRHVLTFSVSHSISSCQATVWSRLALSRLSNKDGSATRTNRYSLDLQTRKKLLQKIDISDCYNCDKRLSRHLCLIFTETGPEYFCTEEMSTESVSFSHAQIILLPLISGVVDGNLWLTTYDNHVLEFFRI